MEEGRKVKIRLNPLRLERITSPEKKGEMSENQGFGSKVILVNSMLNLVTPC